VRGAEFDEHQSTVGDDDQARGALVAALSHVDDLLALREQTGELRDLAPQQPFRASVELRCDGLRDLLLRGWHRPPAYRRPQRFVRCDSSRLSRP
jgi:hypothetical protein